MAINQRGWHLSSSHRAGTALGPPERQILLPRAYLAHRCVIATACARCNPGCFFQLLPQPRPHPARPTAPASRSDKGPGSPGKPPGQSPPATATCPLADQGAPGSTQHLTAAVMAVAIRGPLLTPAALAAQTQMQRLRLRQGRSAGPGEGPGGQRAAPLAAMTRPAAEIIVINLKHLPGHCPWVSWGEGSPTPDELPPWKGTRASWSRGQGLLGSWLWSSRGAGHRCSETGKRWGAGAPQGARSAWDLCCPLASPLRAWFALLCAPFWSLLCHPHPSSPSPRYATHSLPSETVRFRAPSPPLD